MQDLNDAQPVQQPQQAEGTPEQQGLTFGVNEKKQLQDNTDSDLNKPSVAYAQPDAGAYDGPKTPYIQDEFGQSGTLNEVDLSQLTSETEEVSVGDERVSLDVTTDPVETNKDDFGQSGTLTSETEEVRDANLTSEVEISEEELESLKAYAKKNPDAHVDQWWEYHTGKPGIEFYNLPTGLQATYAELFSSAWTKGKA